MPVKPHKDGVTVTIRLTPSARRADIGNVTEVAGHHDTTVKALRVSVTAVPEDGRANKDLIALLTKQWKIPKTSMAIIAGDTNRTKTVLIHGDTADLMQKINPAPQ